jgi:hypothetical protein
MDLHASYTQRYNEDAFAFVQGKLKYEDMRLRKTLQMLTTIAVVLRRARRATAQNNHLARVRSWPLVYLFLVLCCSKSDLIWFQPSHRHDWVLI